VQHHLCSRGRPRLAIGSGFIFLPANGGGLGDILPYSRVEPEARKTRAFFLAGKVNILLLQGAANE
jgi:hypothetical protein